MLLELKYYSQIPFTLPYLHRPPVSRPRLIRSRDLLTLWMLLPQRGDTMSASAPPWDNHPEVPRTILGLLGAGITGGGNTGSLGMPNNSFNSYLNYKNF